MGSQVLKIRCESIGFLVPAGSTRRIERRRLRSPRVWREVAESGSLKFCKAKLSVTDSPWGHKRHTYLAYARFCAFVTGAAMFLFCEAKVRAHLCKAKNRESGSRKIFVRKFICDTNKKAGPLGPASVRTIEETALFSPFSQWVFFWMP